MGMRGIFHEERVDELVMHFKVWREQRLPGVRAFQSTYDRIGILVCRWLFQVLHDINASSAFDYILPLMVRRQLHVIKGHANDLSLKPELFRFTESESTQVLLVYIISTKASPSVNDNDDLAHRAKLLLIRMCGVIPPRSLINPLLDAIFTAIQTSPVSHG